MALQIVGLLGAAFGTTPSYAEGQKFLALCLNPHLAKEVAVTIKGLKTLASDFEEKENEQMNK